MARSSTPVLKPSPLLALVALGLVYRLHPDWLAVNLQQASRQHGESPERVCRLVTRAIAGFEAVLVALTRRGRPPRQREADQMQTELVLGRALLTVTTAIVAQASLRGHALRELIVGAWQRLAKEPGMTQARFCAALSLPARTLRSWLKTLPSGGRPSPLFGTPEPVKPQRPPRKRPPRRGRFAFDVMLPQTQIGADTTDLSAFGVGLKLVAAQDIGGRDERLFDAVLVDDHESAEHVAHVLTQALGDRAGAQAITDQGTPYMAEQTRAALAALEVEHAAQREGDPLGKSTVERAFRTVKSIARPLLGLTDRIAANVPALHDASLAKGIASLLITALLRAYLHGARAARAAQQARGGLDSEALSRLAQQSRERARADERSRRLLLAHIHEVYQIQTSVRSFVNSFYRYPLDVLREAEQAFQAQVHRDDIRDRSSYFAALVRRFHGLWRTQQARASHQRAQDEQASRQQAHQDAIRAVWHQDPAAWLRDALELLSLQWRPALGTLLFDGAGLGLGWVRASLRRLADLFGPTAAADIASGVLHGFLAAHAELGPEGKSAIQALVLRHLPPPTARAHAQDLAGRKTPIKLHNTGRNQRPPPSARLPD
jgi:hypothetical protein